MLVQSEKIVPVTAGICNSKWVSHGGLDLNEFEEKALQGSGSLVSENMFAVACAIGFSQNPTSLLFYPSPPSLVVCFKTANKILLYWNFIPQI